MKTLEHYPPTDPAAHASGPNDIEFLALCPPGHIVHVHSGQAHFYAPRNSSQESAPASSTCAAESAKSSAEKPTAPQRSAPKKPADEKPEDETLATDATNAAQ